MELQKDWLLSKTHAREQKDPRSPISHWNKHSLHLNVAAAGTPEDELMTPGSTLLDVCSEIVYILVQQ